MSRSYKKTPIYKSKDYWVTKRLANKKVRNTPSEEIPSGKSGYKRVVQQYDINDYISYWTAASATKNWYDEGEDGWRHKRYGTLENYLFKVWSKYQKRK